MKYYEIYNWNGNWEIWEFAAGGVSCKKFKVFKTRKGAESWAKKQWYRVIWR